MPKSHRNKRGAREHVDIAASGVRKRTIVKNGQVVGVEAVKANETAPHVSHVWVSAPQPPSAYYPHMIFEGGLIHFGPRPTPKDSMRDAIENARKLHPDVFEGK